MERINGRRRLIETGAVFSFFLGVLLTATLYGKGHVSYAPPRVRTLSAPYYAVNAWREAGVHGRILFLFDRHLWVDPPDFSPLPANYIELSLEENLLRKIYHVVPDSVWHEVEQALEGQPGVARWNEGYRITMGEGTPVYVLRLRSVPRVTEKVLLSINADIWDDAQRKNIRAFLRSGRLMSDVVTVSGTVLAGEIQELESSL